MKKCSSEMHQFESADPEYSNWLKIRENSKKSKTRLQMVQGFLSMKKENR